MSSLSNDQRFVVLLVVALASGAWLSGGTDAQVFSPEDRGSLMKFINVLASFLDRESENASSTEIPSNATTVGEVVESTTLAGNTTTDSTTTESTTASNSTSESIESTSESTTLTTSETSEATTSSSTTSTTTSSTNQVSVAPRRICFKRVCYKFAGDKGYIY